MGFGLSAGVRGGGVVEELFSNGWCMDYDGLPQIVGIMGLPVVLRVDGTGD